MLQIRATGALLSVSIDRLLRTKWADAPKAPTSRNMAGRAAEAGHPSWNPRPAIPASSTLRPVCRRDELVKRVALQADSNRHGSP